jgi:septal ring factor EnvC (AmiA/AmiB activator)
VDELAAEVASASQEQTQGITQVNLAVSEMDKVTQSNAANAEESASAAEELNAQADALKDAVSELLALVDGEAALKGRSASASQPVASRPRAEGRKAAPKAEVFTSHGGNGHDHGFPMPTRQHGASPVAFNQGKPAREAASADFKDM